MTPWFRPCLAAGALALCGPAAWSQTMTTVTGLSFGALAVSQAGTVSVATNGARTATGGVHLMRTAQGAAATFSIKGKNNMAYAITLPANNTVFLSNGSGQTLAINNFVTNLTDQNLASRNGNFQFAVGATLSAGGAAPRGAYSGTFSVIVNYQ